MLLLPSEVKNVARSWTFGGKQFVCYMSCDHESTNERARCIELYNNYNNYNTSTSSSQLLPSENVSKLIIRKESKNKHNPKEDRLIL